ncbi:uncharacterized protein B0I36DRAFT_325114 [Microdochium trichocladiopsis]|uniref:Uncharacterized protein n=1 Tax=Microdochium trichocladiopsis TaxID=1682393 RepID=A0A9P8Y6N6_9PEZI|nr:uncharacterized protein B0I36DRAFT_325114 [Microdochium trichocladiopsis]KAH7029136.1 hypothetical protein B0I36DRAFT_325114 [Microdochium trichocladiopsis]
MCIASSGSRGRAHRLWRLRVAAHHSLRLGNGDRHPPHVVQKTIRASRWEQTTSRWQIRVTVCR